MTVQHPEAVAFELMTSPVRGVQLRDRIQDVAAMFTEDAISAAIVYDAEENPVGVITKTDIVRYERDRCEAHGKHAPKDEDLVERWMMAAIFSVDRTMPRKAIAREMVKYGVHHVFVKDSRSGKVVGVISSFDILRNLAFGDVGPEKD